MVRNILLLVVCLLVSVGAGLPAENRPQPKAAEAGTPVDSFVYDSKGKKDPFLPGEFAWTNARTVAKLRESKLDGIVWDDTSPLIILEGNVLKVGDSYIGARVQSIEKDRAVFLVGDEKVTVFAEPPK